MFLVPLAAGLMLLSAAYAQSFPSRPIRLIAADAGGGPDNVARQLAYYAPTMLGQPIVIDNQPGGNGAIAAQGVMKAQPDGQTLLIYSGGIWTFPLIQKASYDPVRDFAPVMVAAMSPSIVVVHPSLPVKTVRDLIALAKARPGELNYASGGLGSTNHLAAELFKYMAHVDIARIPYKGGADAQADLIAGRVQLTFTSALIAMPMVKSGRLRALAVTSLRPSALFPGLPTAAATGLPGYESVSRYNVFAPARTPDAIVSRINEAFVRILSISDAKARLFDAGAEVVASSPGELMTAMQSEMARLAPVIRNLNLKPE
jgi:tripartite-type tricarboxylate transporter receptor subunit TctC